VLIILLAMGNLFPNKSENISNMESTFGTGILKFPVNIQLTSITYRFYLMKIHN